MYSTFADFTYLIINEIRFHERGIYNLPVSGNDVLQFVYRYSLTTLDFMILMSNAADMRSRV
jgi:hypothetical protein